MRSIPPLLRRSLPLLVCALLSPAVLPAASGGRDALRAEALLAGDVEVGLVPHAAFLPTDDAREMPEPLELGLRFAETPMVVQGLESETWQGSGQTLFPEVELRLVSQGGELVPADRGIVRTGERGRSFYNVIFGVGRVWEEPGDGGWARASLPFTLTTNSVGVARNGVVTFLVRGEETSPAFLQIAQETAPPDVYVRGDATALVPLERLAGSGPPRDSVLAAWRAEREQRLPRRPLSMLPEGSTVARALDGGIGEATDVSESGILWQGVLYTRPQATRAGPYPFPEEMRHGVFSVTKSIGAGLAMFYLAERFGAGVFDEPVAAHVPRLAALRCWEGATFRHLLNMAVGTEASDDGLGPMIRARSAADRLDAVAEIPCRGVGHGEAFLYGSQHTFTLSVAMQSYFEGRVGAGEDLWDAIARDVLEPIGAGGLPLQRTVEADGRGVPLLGWGAYPTLDELAKLARLFRDEGEHEGRQLLHRGSLRTALHRERRGAFFEGYRHSMWWKPDAEGRRAPTMVGHGGNLVVLAPHPTGPPGPTGSATGASAGPIVLRLTDGADYDVAPLCRAAALLRTR